MEGRPGVLGLVCFVMPSFPDSALHPSRTSLRALEASNFFLADVQTGLGPFVAAYLVASHWTPSAALYALTVGGLMTVALQTPAGGIADQVRRKRLIVVAGSVVLGVGALLLACVALAAFLMLFFLVPETGRKDDISPARVDAAFGETPV